MEAKGIGILKALFMAYVFTIVMLLILSFGLYKLDLSQNVVQGGIIAIYILSSFIGGRIAGKLAKSRRFIWGTIVGGLYFALLFMISVLVYHNTIWGQEMMVSALLCLAGGMLGGMLS